MGPLPQQMVLHWLLLDFLQYRGIQARFQQVQIAQGHPPSHPQVRPLPHQNCRLRVLPLLIQVALHHFPAVLLFLLILLNLLPSRVVLLCFQLRPSPLLVACPALLPQSLLVQMIPYPQPPVVSQA